ncbi:NUDIX domain-containing protein [Hallella colorans]|uniref:Isopentenyl-diphosphate delta-isomerase type 1 n=1 Tax=Hallella colorans TaxID=1703337 RepID=A0A2U0UP36_9BACT|nr:NUDIX domain-containing protein [Hallella colorans]PVX59421.1 isopentenyl-diphosphate delta-isomerase type 1 [Hallella colorans]
MEDVVLLTNRNKFMEKIKAHKLVLKHYAFSIIIFNIENEMLLQQRALTKYHSGGLWSNACCGHPLSVDSIFHIKHQAIQRLFEELGFTTDIHYQCTCEY